MSPNAELVAFQHMSCSFAIVALFKQSCSLVYAINLSSLNFLVHQMQQHG
jgi:hypothetical protein